MGREGADQAAQDPRGDRSPSPSTPKSPTLAQDVALREEDLDDAIAPADEPVGDNRGEAQRAEPANDADADVEIIYWRRGPARPVDMSPRGPRTIEITAATINVEPNESYSKTDAKTRKERLITFAKTLNLPPNRLWLIQEPLEIVGFISGCFPIIAGQQFPHL